MLDKVPEVGWGPVRCQGKTWSTPCGQRWLCPISNPSFQCLLYFLLNLLCPKISLDISSFFWTFYPLFSYTPACSSLWFFFRMNENILRYWSNSHIYSLISLVFFAFILINLGKKKGRRLINKSPWHWVVEHSRLDSLSCRYCWATSLRDSFTSSIV